MVFCSICVYAQPIGVASMEKAIAEKKYREAENILQKITGTYFQNRQADSLVNYIFLTGKIKMAEESVNEGNNAIQYFIHRLKTLNPAPATLMQAYIEAGEYYGFTGNNDKGYASNMTAFEYAVKAKSSGSQLALVQNNLSTFAQRRGKIELAKEHGYKALGYLKNDPVTNYQTLYITQNGIGSAMYYESRLDSAIYFFNAALGSLGKAPKSPVNQLYRPAILLNNLAGIYIQQGNSSKAIESMLQVIDKLDQFSKVPGEEKKKSTGIRFRLEAIDNLAGVYKDIGDLQKARDLLEYSYQSKRELLTEHNPGIFYSQILLGQLYYAMREPEKAILYLKEGIKNYENYNPDQWIALGDGYSTLAFIYDFKKSYTLAEQYYNTADSLFELSMQGSFDLIYLEFLRNKAQFLAEKGKSKEAMKVANRCYSYIVAAQGKESLDAFYQLLNFSKIEYLRKNFSPALDYAEKGLDLIDRKLTKAPTLVDSVKLEIYKPLAILYKSLASYNMPGGKEKIKSILNELDQAIEIIERKKGLVNSPENNRIILAENKELFDFVKQLNLELYHSTGKESYIDRVMSLQESALYTRIRSRLDLNDSMKFTYIPQRVIDKGRLLNTAMKKALAEEHASVGSVNRYIVAVNNLNEYKEGMKLNYPKYYELRYESVISSLGAIRKRIHPGTTLLRYFFVDTSMYVFVGDQSQEQIIKLNPKNLDGLIGQISSPDFSVMKDALVRLYEMLWEPVNMYIHNKKIIVIPDGILYTLNLEILTPKPIQSYRELADKSLLGNYTFSYHYSIFLLGQSERSDKSSPLFAGYAPGFSEDLKKTYLSSVKDSFYLDRNYMNLLPQPFTTSLLSRIKDLFNGKSYTGANCTKEQFVSTAGNHKIIHVATHAFSDNIFPEYSKLIFAKENSSQSNELLASDIYGYNMQSDLTVLSACETGRPGYEDGEGMISLAHAFHYSGSKSLLTGLWKIDEKASAILLESFYEYLGKGMAKDEALRLAKLDYLKNQNGRMLAPEYWAGLVIIGDTAPIDIPQSGGNYGWYILFSVTVLTFVFWIFWNRGKMKSAG